MLVGAPMEHPARVEEVVHVAHLLVTGADLVALVLHLDNPAEGGGEGRVGRLMRYQQTRRSGLDH